MDSKALHAGELTRANVPDLERMSVMLGSEVVPGAFQSRGGHPRIFFAIFLRITLSESVCQIDFGSVDGGMIGGWPLPARRCLGPCRPAWKGQ